MSDVCCAGTISQPDNTGRDDLWQMDGGDQLRIVSQMPENGMIFSDGMEEDSISFHAGMEIKIQTASKRGKLVPGI